MPPLSCIVVGDAAVTLRCAEILLAQGHALLGIVTGDGRVAGWAAERALPCRFEPQETPLTRPAVEDLVGGRPFDLLFSIHNLRILPPEVLALPRRMAVNYHDAPLPRYAGLHATTWALWRGETTHGITWHRMTERVDAGEILAQRSVPLEPDDTAWTASARCTEAAIEAFPEVIAGLAAGTPVLREQEAAERTFFPGWRRPAPGCVIPWDAPAERIAAFVRALDYGVVDNPLGIPKVLAPDGPLLVQGVEELGRRSGAPPGTVLASRPAEIEVATATRDARVRLAGGTVEAGVRLPSQAPGELAEWERKLKRHEPYWTSALVHLAPLAPPGFQGGEGEQRIAIPLGTDLAAVLSFLHREIGQPFDVGLGGSSWPGLLARRPPFRVDGDSVRDLPERLRGHRERGTYPIDLPARLRRLRSRQGPAEPLVAVDLLDGAEEPPPLGPAILGVALSPGKLLWRCRGEGDLEGLASRFRSSEIDRPSGNDLSALFREQAARTPAALAVEADGERWTYGEIAGRAQRLGAALRRRGVGPERVVALRLDRLPDLVTGLLGVLEAGGAFLVLDPLDSPARQARILEEARPTLALGDAGLHRLAPDLPVHPIALADAPEGPQAPASRDIEGGDLAYVAFTSGSTGNPKGVAVEHRAIAHYIQEAGRRFGLGPGDRLLQLGSPAFDLAYEQIFGALCHGATLVGMPEPGLPEPRELSEACGRLGVTVLDLPTAVWDQAARAAVAMPDCVRLVVIGGDAARTRSARSWLAAAGASRLLNTYGPTETTVVATWWEAPADPAQLPAAETLPIGQAIPGVETIIVEEELWIGGAGLARGYHRRPGLTAERFVHLHGKRFYRTGDRVRLRQDGELEHLGRLDRQVKIAGRRVEPGEVEAVLREIPGVAEAAVEPVEGAPRLAAWVVLEAGAPLSRVREEMARRLPSYLRPARLAAVASLPRSPAGKLDLGTLREPEEPPANRPAPRLDPMETRLAALWQRLLGGGAVSRDDDFFDLGGDSLSAIQLLAEIEAAFGQRVPVARLLRASTVASLAAEIRAQGGRERPSCIVPLQPEGEAPPFFCVHGLGGHLLRLIPLARAFAPGHPLLGFQSPGLDDDEPVPRTIEELARVFVNELRNQGEGPFHLGGMSFGGVVAFEMARQMAAQGIETGLLALFDPDLDEVLPGLRPAGPPWRKRLKARLRRLAGDSLGRARRLIRRVRNGRDEVWKPNEYRHFTRVQRINDAALGRYVPGPYPGKVTFFAATPRAPLIYQEFQRRTGCELEIVPMPGDHLGMLEPPHVEALAAELLRRLSYPSKS